jgi:hypothetical protein
MPVTRTRQAVAGTEQIIRWNIWHHRHRPALQINEVRDTAKKTGANSPEYAVKWPTSNRRIG